MSSPLDPYHPTTPTLYMTLCLDLDLSPDTTEVTVEL